jgi:hypothetical protein
MGRGILGFHRDDKERQRRPFSVLVINPLTALDGLRSKSFAISLACALVGIAALAILMLLSR